jgi:hypothetical protein
MVKDLGSTELQKSPLEAPIDASAEIVLDFIAYLKKIDRINKLLKDSSEKLKLHSFILSQHLRAFDTTELIDLACIIDQFDITNNDHLIEELAQRMRPPIKEIECFNSFNNKPILRSVMQKLCKDAQLDTIIIQPYANTLNQCSSVPRTESLIQNFKNNMYNAFSWHSPILLMPHYINLQTGTIIKSEEHMNSSNMLLSTTKLYIYQKNNPPVIIPFNNIKSITNIEANSDESLFICKCQDITTHQSQHYIIDPTNPDKHYTCYDLCTFTENNEELYAVTNNIFGIFNAKTNKFTPININLDTKSTISHISTNKNKTKIAIVVNIPIVTDKITIDIFIGEKIDQNGLTFKQFNIKSFTNIEKSSWKTGITNICLHPHENKIYLESISLSCIVDLDTLNDTLFQSIPFMIREAHEIFFMSDDILFIGYETGKDYFVNIRTGNHWIKDKQSGSRRHALTTDNMHSIEKVTKPIEGKTTITLEIRQIIDDTIINTVNCLNQGYYPLTLLTIAQQKKGIITLNDSDTIDYQHLNENLKTVLNTTHTITNPTLLARIQAPFRYIWPTVSYYGKIGAAFMTSVVVYALFNLLIKRVSKNRLDNNDTRNLLDGILWLAKLALG